jgi:EAL domain-containing protein (putative c-di-GMP-specific phosphodiesterase class I)
VQVVADALERAGLDPGRLTLEITETELFTKPVVAARAIEGLRRLGCALAIDDFGTGYSSLSRLVEVPAATLKVDQSFTQALATRPEVHAVVSSVLLLGRRLRRTVVMEGVEDAGTLDELRELGVTHAQGFHLVRPQPADELGRLLASLVPAP